MQRALMWLSTFGVDIYYRRINLGNPVPSEGPVILVANHPNGLVDPIVLAGVSSRPPRFLAKEPLFRMPVLGWLMRISASIPVYRAQDGSDTGLNERTFDAVFEALGQGSMVCLFPEGLSHSEPGLQRIKTGAARMAIGAEAKRNFSLGVQVLPVGLVYPAKRRPGSTAVAWVGRPITCGDLGDLHAEDPWRAVEQLTERIDEGLRSVMVEVEHWEDVPLIQLAERMWRPEYGQRMERLQAFARGLRHLRREQPERVEPVVERLAAYRERLNRLGLGLGDLDRKPSEGAVRRFALSNGLRLLFGLPFAVLGAVLWYLPWRAIPAVAERLKPSRDVYATFHILGGAVFLPLWWLGMCLAAHHYLGILGLLAALTLAPWAGLFCLRFGRWRQAVFGDAAAFLRLANRRRLRELLIAQRDSLVAELDELSTHLPDSPPPPE